MKFHWNQFSVEFELQWENHLWNGVQHQAITNADLLSI